ncbi:Phage tail assembly chaperone protein, TAC [Oceanobacillus limi]|uniref:Phage tail assembly chaperone protein, TAC n=1 Tax=Oceanobacillus limi TaxID=930131 RepID=A0A1I0GDV8_9BACI|nr:tail assembly chaperone [Oceanobacillus limi]SET69239.1 Phage tail assembly chaperone protein, TAC [Oceanobacillus limi]
MERFEINNEEHELKITLDSVKYLNGLYEGGAFMLIQKAISGDIDTYVSIVYAGLFHTEKGFKRKDVEKAIEDGIANENIDLDLINRTSYGVVAESFFYKKTLDKMFKNDPDAKKQIEALMK